MKTNRNQRTNPSQHVDDVLPVVGNAHGKPWKAVRRHIRMMQLAKPRDFQDVDGLIWTELSMHAPAEHLVSGMVITHQSFDGAIAVFHELADQGSHVVVATGLRTRASKLHLNGQAEQWHGCLLGRCRLPRNKFQHAAALRYRADVDWVISFQWHEALLRVICIKNTSYQP